MLKMIWLIQTVLIHLYGKPEVYLIWIFASIPAYIFLSVWISHSVGIKVKKNNRKKEKRGNLFVKIDSTDKILLRAAMGKRITPAEPGDTRSRNLEIKSKYNENSIIAVIPRQKFSSNTVIIKSKNVA